MTRIISGSEHVAFEEMVLAQGLGNANRQAPRGEKGDRGPGTPVVDRQLEGLEKPF
jgi:hypothetical protein